MSQITIAQETRRSVLKCAAAVAVATTTLPVETMLENTETKLFPRVEIDPKEIFQKIFGFGGAMTDSSAYNIWISPKKDEIMRALFDAKKGIGLSLLRLPIGGSDFIVHNTMYSYDDLPQGETDVNLAHFSIDHDREYILPLLRQAVKLNPDVKFIASPWSPPGWMKSNRSLLGTIEKKVGTLLPEYYSTYANYLVKFIQAYQAEGIAIDILTPQNEPLSPVDTYPGMLLTAEEEAMFIKEYLYPALKKANLPTKIYAYDQNWDQIHYPSYILSSSALDSIDGIAWHGYSGEPDTMTKLHTAFPRKSQLVTEVSPGLNRFGTTGLLIEAMKNWASGVVFWNLALDEAGGPKIGAGCNNCTGLTTITKDGYKLTDDYYELGNFSKYIKLGAKRIQAVTKGQLESLAFQNPDGSYVLIVVNISSLPMPFSIHLQDQSRWYIARGRGVSTFQMRGE
jgi:glucosylceramidase